VREQRHGVDIAELTLEVGQVLSRALRSRRRRDVARRRFGAFAEELLVITHERCAFMSAFMSDRPQFFRERCAHAVGGT